MAALEPGRAASHPDAEALSAFCNRRGVATAAIDLEPGDLYLFKAGGGAWGPFDCLCLRSLRVVERIACCLRLGAPSAGVCEGGADCAGPSSGFVGPQTRFWAPDKFLYNRANPVPNYFPGPRYSCNIPGPQIQL